MIPQGGKISLRQLSPHGIHGSLCIHQVLSDRTFRVKLAASTSPSFPPSDGVQQSIAEHHIIKRINFSPTTLYVGDLTIHASGLSLPVLRQLLQIAVTLISYVIDRGFRSSTSKSFSIHFFCSCIASQSPLSIWCPNPISLIRQVPRCHSSSNCSGGTISILLKKNCSPLAPALADSQSYTLGIIPQTTPPLYYHDPPHSWLRLPYTFFIRLFPSRSPWHNPPQRSSINPRSFPILSSWEPMHWIGFVISFSTSCPSLFKEIFSFSPIFFHQTNHSSFTSFYIFFSTFTYSFPIHPFLISDPFLSLPIFPILADTLFVHLHVCFPELTNLFFSPIFLLISLPTSPVPIFIKIVLNSLRLLVSA